mmetsp:Transcript_32804/g.103759  ORF Transcript_32804/g.103759 Transcript_32804/m.103759 type:complete len:247 (+) Transcript_32804:719-1459(+)
MSARMLHPWHADGRDASPEGVRAGRATVVLSVVEEEVAEARAHQMLRQRSFRQKDEPLPRQPQFSCSITEVRFRLLGVLEHNERAIRHLHEDAHPDSEEFRVELEVLVPVAEERASLVETMIPPELLLALYSPDLLQWRKRASPPIGPGVTLTELVAGDLEGVGEEEELLSIEPDHLGGADGLVADDVIDVCRSYGRGEAQVVNLDGSWTHREGRKRFSSSLSVAVNENMRARVVDPLRELALLCS